jgi:ATP-dependent protease ClpP protease subunit
MTAEQAKAYGLVDEVLENTQSAEKKKEGSEDKS